MADEPKNDPPKDPPKDLKDPPAGDPPGGDPPKDPPKDDGLEALVKAEVAKVLGENRPQSMPRQSLESLAEQKVRDAVKVLRLEEENQKMKADLETGKLPEGEGKKETAEVIPKKVRRLTKAFWGNPDE